jgi:hypothetical protein
VPAADAGAWGIKETPRPDTLPEIVSVATDTAQVPLRRGFDPAEIIPVSFTFLRRTSRMHEAAAIEAGSVHAF